MGNTNKKNPTSTGKAKVRKKAFQLFQKHSQQKAAASKKWGGGAPRAVWKGLFPEIVEMDKG